MYLLDTNICIFIVNRKPPQVIARLKEHGDEALFVSSISVAELQYGVYRSASVQQNRLSLAELLTPFQILNFDSTAAEQYGLLRAELVRKGQTIGALDMLIAAQAMANGLTLVTSNLREFRRIKQLRVEDWKGQDGR